MTLISGSIGSLLRTSGFPLSESFSTGEEYTVSLMNGPGYLTIETKRDNNGFYSTTAAFSDLSASNMVDRSFVRSNFMTSAYLGSQQNTGSLTFTPARDLGPNEVIVKIVTPNYVTYVNVPLNLAIQDLLNALRERSEEFENKGGSTSILRPLYGCEDTVNELLVTLEARSTYFENYNDSFSTLDYIDKTIDNNLPNDNILIFIAGQSNALGSTGNTLPSERHLNQYIPDTYMWTGSVGQEQFERLVVDKTNISNTRSHGAELNLGYLLSSVTNGNIYLVKVAKGGTGFQDNRWNPGDDLYNDLEVAANQAVAHLNDSGVNFTYGGLYWNQGEKDSNGTQQDAEDYDTNLTNFINSIRTDISGSSNIEFMFTRLGTTFINRPATDYGDIVRANQELVNSTVSNTTIINTDDLPLRDDDTHYNNDGQNILGQRVATIVENNL